MPKLLYQGHGSSRVTTDDGRVIYIDPFTGDGYDLPADVILVTHDHSDHNCVDIVTKKPDCCVVTSADAVADGAHNTFDFGGGLIVEAVEAKNWLHNPKKCVGYIITLDGATIYALGDTSKTEQMKSFAARKLDYALFPLDGFFTMGLKTGAECARLVGARHNIPVHIKPGQLFDRKRAEKWDAPNRLIIEPGEEITL